MPTFVRVFALFCVAFASFLAASTFAAADELAAWQMVDVPQVWKSGMKKGSLTRDGYAWFRCAVTVPDTWRGDATLFVESIDDAREIFFNGKKVGTLGSMPPRFRSGLGTSVELNIPSKLLRPGKNNTVAIRMYQLTSRENFNVAAPVLFHVKHAIRMHGAWQWRAGDDAKTAALPADSEVAFAKVIPAADARRDLRRLPGEIGPLPPAQTLKHMKTPDDLDVDLVLAEPHFGQPLSLKFDERGRMWVANYLQYPDPAGLKAVSRDKYLRTVYDRKPLPPPDHFPGADKITIHEDTDGDGKPDKHKTFVDGLSLATSFAIGRGGVWVLQPPYLLFYKDANRDDKPDGDPEVHLEGFGLEDSHSVANNLRWGPDGWLYAAQGSTVTGHVKTPGSEAEPVHSLGQLIWRYHPELRKYEVFGEGGGNTFGVEIDSKGRIFSGHNGGDTRGFHYLQGSYSQKGFGKHGELSNPYAFGYFPAMQHHRVARFTHTFTIYEGGGLPAAYNGKLFGVGPLQSHVVYSDMQPERSSFKTNDLGYALTSADTWFRPVDIQPGPAGGLYVLDFYEQRIDHASHYQGRVDKKSGRIYRLHQPGANGFKPFDYGTATAAELLEALQSKNRWRRQTALRVIGDRRDQAMLPPLKKLLEGGRGQTALEALWAINLCGGFNETLAADTLKHVDPYVRAWTVRLLCDDHEISGGIARQLVELAAAEPHVEVRSQLACSARRLPADQGLPLVKALLKRSEDAGDGHLPLLLWWAIEHHADHCQQVMAMLREEEMWRLPIVNQHILQRLMRRYATAGDRVGLMTCEALLRKSPSKEHTAKLLAGFEQAYAGRPLTALPPRLMNELAKAAGDSLTLQLRQGDKKAVEQALQIIADTKADQARRLRYVGIFSQVKTPAALPVLLKIAVSGGNKTVRTAAISALQVFAEDEVATTLLPVIPKADADTREVILELLASRGDWTRALLNAVDDGKLKPDAVPVTVVRRMKLHGGAAIEKGIATHWKLPAGGKTADREEIVRLTAVINEAAGNPYNGKELYGNLCGKCHKLFGKGGDAGPDLTAYQRGDITRLLMNVLAPDAEIREGYETYTIVTEEGRILTGLVTQQDKNVVVVRSAADQETSLPRDSIEEMQANPQSLMPAGLLEKFTDQQLRDLFAYLRATQPLP